MQRIRSLWQGLDARGRIIAALSLLAIAAAIFGITRVAGRTETALLYSGLDPAAAGEVVAALEAGNVPYEVRGTAIYVAAETRDRLRLDLAARGLPANGEKGYEILDTLSGFGTTSQMFDAAYWRAKEGELARTITAGADVRAARVHLANPVNQPFARAARGGASVTVTMARGALDPGRARAIRYLVSSAVTGLSPDEVAVLDSDRGVVLAGKEEGADPGAGPKPADRAEALRKSVQRLLEARVGPGRAIVEVNVEAEMERQTITERVIDPESRAAVSSETEQNSESSKGSNPGVTVASNLPDGDAKGGNESTRSTSQSRERHNFDMSETRRERVIEPGRTRRISVAVMVDGITEPGPEGAPVWSPRPPEELETLRLLVRSAIGFDAARGDTVTLETLRFPAVAEEGSLAERAPGLLDGQAALLAQIGALAVIVLALILFVLRPMLSRRPEPAFPALSGPEGALSAAEGASDLLDLPARSQTRIERLREVIASRGEDSAAVLRSWIESPEKDTEPAQS
ncbi:flagellar basal-body MS-ring/collar protein FliF [Amaricoccus solimangrovi]|uniref:flagellar basal-body MS-ring/collar protein FliF n=1 Tax=Amaricoccus solimangrovi TaxID=2589815 RepID=UPI001F166B94|nr:flagellar basal-body MS-ring/collar protein FliF [Amaricoccus solimangrovi]